MTRCRCLWRRLGLGFAVALGLFFLLPYLVPDPGGPPLESDRRQVAEAANGYPLLVQAVAALRKSDDLPGDYPSRKPVTPALRAYLAANEPALALLAQALAKPDLQFPEPDGWADAASMASAAGCRELARLKQQRGLLRIAEGDLAGGLRDHLDVIRFGRRFADVGGMLIDYLVGVAIESIGLRGLSDSLAPLPWPADTPDRQRPSFRPLPPLSPSDRAAWEAALSYLTEPYDGLGPVQRSLACEYRVATRSLPKMLAAGTLPEPALGGSPALARLRTPIFDQSHTIGLMRRSMRDLINLAAEPAWQRDPDSTLGVRLGERGPRGYNPVGRILVSLQASPMIGLPIKADELEATRRATAVAIALRLYWDDYGQLPATLDDLVTGGLLEAVPLDPFDGAPLRYDRARAVVWSIGADGRDDGGDPAQENRFEPDRIFPLSFAPAT